MHRKVRNKQSLTFSKDLCDCLPHVRCIVYPVGIVLESLTALGLTLLFLPKQQACKKVKLRTKQILPAVKVHTEEHLGCNPATLHQRWGWSASVRAPSSTLTPVLGT